MSNLVVRRSTNTSLRSYFNVYAMALFSSRAIISDTNVEVHIENRLEKFPIIWLKDNCTCKNCTFVTRTRLINWNHFNLDSKIKDLKTESDAVKIMWDDNHESTYSFKWLKERSFSRENRENHMRSGRPEKKIWGKNDFIRIMNSYQFNDVLSNDEVFYNWLMDLAVHGMVLVKNAPLTDDGSQSLIKRVGFYRRSHYGKSFYVTARPNANNQAYLSKELQIHVDLPYYEYRPGVQMLHCIVQSKVGGNNLLVDGFYVAEQLRKLNKKQFDILSQTYVNWQDHGEDDNCLFNKKLRLPVIGLNKDGEVERITHSIAQRDSLFSVDIGIVDDWYRALKVFIETLYENAAEFKLEQGDILLFDNLRLLHGRRAYNDTDNINRFLIGTYIDWDEIYSKLNVIKGLLNK